jgi:adenylate cyclase class IV
LPAKEISTQILVDEFYKNSIDSLSIERQYKQEQLTKDGLKGKPTHIRYKRASSNAVSMCEFGYTNIIDLRQALVFLGYVGVGVLTQIRTGFFIKTPLIELPVTLNETKEFGCFLEVGEAFGAVEDIQSILFQLQEVTKLPEKTKVEDTYCDLLVRVKNH